MKKLQKIDLQAFLLKLEDIAEKSHRKEFLYETFNRKYRGILKFKKKRTDLFSVSIKGYEPVTIKIESTPDYQYAICSVKNVELLYSFPCKTNKDLIQKILRFGLLTKRKKNIPVWIQ